LRANARFQRIGKRNMGKPRIIVTCPQTGVAVITNIAYEDVTGPNKKRMFFACACGETHKLLFAGRHGERRDPSFLPPTSPRDTHRAS
jgi:hypothetical protein